MSLVMSWESEAGKVQDERAALSYLTEQSNAFATEIVAEWWVFAGSIFSKYNHYVVMHSESPTGTDVLGQVLPEWWLQSPEVGFASWAPEGPYHGKILDASVLLAMTKTGGLELSAAFVLGIMCTALLFTSMSATIAYKMGIRKGRQNLDAAYYMQP